MGKLVCLSDYRDAAQGEPAGAAPAAHPYYCTRCGAEQFTLGSTGQVQCAGCGALMRNLAVRDALWEASRTP